MQKLSQVLAIERNVKGRAHSALTNLHRAAQHPALFNGFSKHFEPLEEGGEELPPESQRVQLTAESVTKDVRRFLAELFDVTATKDAANSRARADVVVNGTTILVAVPAVTLLFLEKQLTDLHTFFTKLPVLDPAVEWNRDEAAGLYKTAAQRTQRTKKLQKPIVLYDATDKHPAQTQLITEDVTVGHWVTVKQSGAMRQQDRDQIVEKIEELHKAVKYAREAANAQEAPQQHVGAAVFDYLFNTSF